MWITWTVCVDLYGGDSASVIPCLGVIKIAWYSAGILLFKRSQERVKLYSAVKV